MYELKDENLTLSLVKYIEIITRIHIIVDGIIWRWQYPVKIKIWKVDMLSICYRNFVNGNITSIGCFLILSMMINGCGLPKSMEVRSGNEPRHQDDDVRFRTTYYFRVYDFCRNEDDSVGEDGEKGEENESPDKIISDGLYRFHMTGKADSLFNEVHFESGVAHKSQIDPFGSGIEYDQRSGKFRFSDSKSENGSSNLLDNRCGNGGMRQRGFQVLGPQGLTTFDQDSRLIMAMTSSGKPLISAMKELSGRMLNEQPNESAVLSWLVNELQSVNKGRERLEVLQQDNNKKPSELVQGIIDVMQNNSLKKSDGNPDKLTLSKPVTPKKKEN